MCTVHISILTLCSVVVGGVLVGVAVVADVVVDVVVVVYS